MEQNNQDLISGQIRNSYYNHPIKRILVSRDKSIVVFKYLLLIIIILVGSHRFVQCLDSFSPKYIYKKDFIQEYLMAKAVLAGVDPYLPCPDLATQFFGLVPDNIVNHPTPHPPPIAVFFMPFGLLSYWQASVAWFVIEIVCLFFICFLLLHWLGRPKWMLTVLMTPALLSWLPFFNELLIGQLMIPLMLLLIIAWQALRHDKNITGGILLGVAITLKLIAWPIVIFLAVKNNWRATITSIAIFVISNLIAGLIISFDKVTNYYLKIGPLIAQLHRNHAKNFSLWSIANRVFEGTNSTILLGLKIHPLFHAPLVAKYFSFVLPISFLIICLFFAYRARSFDSCFGMLICASILISPVAWAPYITLILIPILVAGRMLYLMDWPNKESNIIIFIVVILLISPLPLEDMLHLFVIKFTSNPHYPISFLLGLLTLLPILAIICLLFLIRSLDLSSTHRVILNNE